MRRALSRPLAALRILIVGAAIANGVKPHEPVPARPAVAVYVDNAVWQPTSEEPHSTSVLRLAATALGLILLFAE